MSATALEAQLLREAVRDALSGHDTLQAARGALDGAPLPDLWPVAEDAGWSALLVPATDGGAGLGLGEALTVAVEAGRALAGLPLGTHWAATWLVASAGRTDVLKTAHARAGRGALVPGQVGRDPAASLDAAGRLHGRVRWVPGADGAAWLAVPARDGAAGLQAVLVRADAVQLEAASGYDATRAMAHVGFPGVGAEVLPVTGYAIEQATALQQAVMGAEAVGATEALLDMSVEHARRRRAFGRAIGSFQAVKHQLVEVLRRLDNARALLEPAGQAWAHATSDAEAGSPRAAEELDLACCALRHLASDALEYAARTALAVHGGAGVTWEHDAPLYFRRSQLDRRLLGGSAAAARRVGALLLERAATPRDDRPALS